MAEGREPVAWAGRRAVVAFPEHVGGSSAAQIREQLLAVFDNGAAVVIADMSATVSCDQAGVGAVSLAYQQAAIRRAELRLVATTATVRRLLATQGLDRLVPVYPSLEAAVAAGEPDGPDPAGDSAPSPAAAWWPARPQARPGPVPVSETVLRQLLDALADGIVLADEDGQILLANQRAEAMFGYRPGELAAQPVESLVPASLRDAHRLHRAAYALKPVPRSMADRARLAGRRKDGSTIPVTITLNPVPTASGHFVLAVIRDAKHEYWQDDLTGLVRAALGQQAQHVGDLLDRVVGSLFHVGLSLDQAADQPAELARERIGEALHRLEEIIHEIRDHVFRSPRPDGGESPGDIGP
ncbi:MAG TPA: PAS domain S-box protein [Streptosporangiaceae bacterium]|nr:PAS domain S-box protein [Streptosporangiaceae bacterium]